MRANNIIQVEVVPYRKEYNLWPVHDEETGILQVGARSIKSWPYGLDIDGNIILDLDHRRILSNFDVLISRKYWDKYDKKKEDRSLNYGSLMFSEKSIGIKSFNIPFSIGFFEECLFIDFDTKYKEKAKQRVMLGDSCMALISDNTLVGFRVFLIDFSKRTGR